MRLACLTAAATLTLMSCASLSEEECLAGDWRQIGIADGQAGRAADFIDRHREACAPVGVTPDIAAWAAGRKIGLQAYCTPDNAYRIGRNGRVIRPVCPAESYPALEAANRRGLTWHRIGNDIGDLQRQARDIRAELAALAPDDVARQSQLLAELSRIRLRITMLRARRISYAGL